MLKATAGAMSLYRKKKSKGKVRVGTQSGRLGCTGTLVKKGTGHLPDLVCTAVQVLHRERDIAQLFAEVCLGSATCRCAESGVDPSRIESGGGTLTR